MRGIFLKMFLPWTSFMAVSLTTYNGQKQRKKAFSWSVFVIMK